MIDKILFVQTIEQIQLQKEQDDKCNNAFRVIFPYDFISGYDHHYITNQLVEILQVLFKDNNKDSLIEYFMWELDFGKKYKKGCVSYKNGKNIKLKSASDLYDSLIMNAIS